MIKCQEHFFAGGKIRTRQQKDLSQGIKISITRSISTVFEQYMAKIDWDEDKYDLQDFIREWKEYINGNASWFERVSEETKAHPAFHDELAAKINETIHRILTENPTAEQSSQLEELQKIQGISPEYSCRLEAKYLIEKLSKEEKKRRNDGASR